MTFNGLSLKQSRKILLEGEVLTLKLETDIFSVIEPALLCALIH